jgi:hypothetical protein
MAKLDILSLFEVLLPPTFAWYVEIISQQFRLGTRLLLSSCENLKVRRTSCVKISIFTLLCAGLLLFSVDSWTWKMVFHFSQAFSRQVAQSQ